jgi:hypothetical protein
MGRRIHGPHTEPARSDQVNVIFLEEAELGKRGWNGYENKESMGQEEKGGYGREERRKEEK